MLCAMTWIGTELSWHIQKSVIINVANYRTGFPWTTKNCRLLLKALNLTSNFLLFCGRQAQFRENWTAPEPSDSPLWTIDSLLLHLRTDHRKVFLYFLSLSLPFTPTCASAKFTARRLRSPSAGVESEQRAGRSSAVRPLTLSRQLTFSVG